jgi:hypothetical protein
MALRVEPGDGTYLNFTNEWSYLQRNVWEAAAQLFGVALDFHNCWGV